MSSQVVHRKKQSSLDFDSRKMATESAVLIQPAAARAVTFLALTKVADVRSSPWTH